MTNFVASPPVRSDTGKPEGYSLPRQPRPSEVPKFAAPNFYITGRQRLMPGTLLLATVASVVVLSLVLYGLSHSGHARFSWGSGGANRSAGATLGATAASDNKDDDDPNQVDTIVLGDPTDAPEPAATGNHVSSVHPTILIRLPRTGDQLGLIPNTPAGHLLYDWLAAFNQPSYDALNRALPHDAIAAVTAAQMELRRQTGGFSLLSAKEVQPGVLVFRLHDQTPSSTEVLGTLQVRPKSDPAQIASFSLRAVPPPHSRSNIAAVPPWAAAK